MLWSTLVREPTARKLNDRTRTRVAGDNPLRRATVTDGRHSHGRHSHRWRGRVSRIPAGTVYPESPLSRRISSMVTNGSRPGAYRLAIDHSVSPCFTTTVGAGPTGSAAWLAGAADTTPRPASSSARSTRTARPRRVSRTPGRRCASIATPSSSNGSYIERTYDHGLPDGYDRIERHDAPCRTDG